MTKRYPSMVTHGRGALTRHNANAYGATAPRWTRRAVSAPRRVVVSRQQAGGSWPCLSRGIPTGRTLTFNPAVAKPHVTAAIEFPALTRFEDAQKRSMATCVSLRQGPRPSFRQPHV